MSTGGLKQRDVSPCTVHPCLVDLDLGFPLPISPALADGCFVLLSVNMMKHLNKIQSNARLRADGTPGRVCCMEVLPLSLRLEGEYAMDIGCHETSRHD